MTLAGLQRFGFVLLDEAPGEEIVLGLTGRFWTPSGGAIRVAPEDFAAFSDPGFAQAAWNFTVLPLKSGKTRLATETRVRCADSRSRTLFRAYWLLVRPFSGLIRREALRLVKGEAERAGQVDVDRPA